MSFEDIKGQDNALEILKASLLGERVFSNYLFLGPDGIGKFLAAKNFAKAINCLEGQVGPCEKCHSCKKVNSNTHPDVFFVEPKGISSSVGIDQIRSAIGRANLKPYEAKKKVFIVDNAHSMNSEASNAFLKTLEEPPKDTIFILISRSKDLLLPTIVSRCHVIKFRAASPEVISRVLEEKLNIGKTESRLLGNFSSGRIGRAIKMKEEGAIERKNKIIDALSDENRNFAEEIASHQDREELKENLEFLVAYFRDVFLYKTTGNKETVFHSDKIKNIEEDSQKLSSANLDYLINKIITFRSYVGYNVNPKMIIDVLSNQLRSFYVRSSPSKAA